MFEGIHKPQSVADMSQRGCLKENSCGNRDLSIWLWALYGWPLLVILTIRLLLSFWFRQIELAGYLEPWHLGREKRVSQACERPFSCHEWDWCDCSATW